MFTLLNICTGCPRLDRCELDFLIIINVVIYRLMVIQQYLSALVLVWHGYCSYVANGVKYRIFRRSEHTIIVILNVVKDLNY